MDRSDNSKPATEGALIISSQQLLAGRQQLLIVHEGEIYRLRLTKNNKLILTK